MIFLDQRAIGRDNNFNLLRMLAAIAVLVSHATPIMLGPDAVEPLVNSTGYSLGSTSVTIFFAISGFFITKSFATRSSIRDFIVARVARIFPGLLVCLIITAFIMGPIVTRFSIQDYIHKSDTWTYIPRNMSLRNLQWSLPGVFEKNPYGSPINGSLWTLYHEVRCYAIIALVGLFFSFFMKNPLLLSTLAILMIACIITIPNHDTKSFIELYFPFWLGSVAYSYRNYLPVSSVVLLILLLFAIFLRNSWSYDIIRIITVAYGAIWIGVVNVRGLKRYNKLGDYSYGMYIYAFPIQQLVVFYFGKNIGIVFSILISLVLTAILSISSWYLIESPILKYRHILSRKKPFR